MTVLQIHKRNFYTLGNVVVIFTTYKNCVSSLSFRMFTKTKGELRIFNKCITFGIYSKSVIKQIKQCL